MRTKRYSPPPSLSPYLPPLPIVSASFRFVPPSFGSRIAIESRHIHTFHRPPHSYCSAYQAKRRLRFHPIDDMTMLQIPPPVLKHIVPPEALPESPSTPSNPILAAAPRGWTAPAAASPKRRRNTEDDDENSTAKRIRSIDPTLDAMGAEPTTIGGGVSSPTSSHSNTFTLPNSQDIGKDSPYKSWRDSAERSASTVNSAPILAPNMAPNPQAAFGELYGYDDEGDQSFIEYDTSSEGSDGPTEIVEANFRAELDYVQTVLRQGEEESDGLCCPLRSQQLVTASNEESVVEATTKSALPTKDRAQFQERGKTWHEPGPSPLAHELTSRDGYPAVRPATKRERQIRAIKRDHNMVDRTSARKLVVLAQACLYSDQLPENFRLSSHAAEIARHKMARTLDEADIEPMPHGMSGKGTPPGPRDPSYKRPSLPIPKPPFSYTVVVANKPVQFITVEAFHGPERWATLVPSWKGQGKATPQIRGQKPPCLQLRIRALETNRVYQIYTDEDAMQLLVEHEEARDILDAQGWRGRKTIDIVNEWQLNRIADEAVRAALAEEECSLSPSAQFPSPVSSPSSTAEPDSDETSDTSEETCVSLGEDGEDDLLDWSAFIDPSLFANEPVFQGPISF
ncbi:hypothetical protein GY45DRAFT_1167822 [Cubamyces sp. BRFM 1775]|nr:hypothetical protein GY45DRAFT_1167822 [Cubamyces sp. BRFM 1775]